MSRNKAATQYISMFLFRNTAKHIGLRTPPSPHQSRFLWHPLPLILGRFTSTLVQNLSGSHLESHFNVNYKGSVLVSQKNQASIKFECMVVSGTGTCTAEAGFEDIYSGSPVNSSLTPLFFRGTNQISAKMQKSEHFFGTSHNGRCAILLLDGERIFVDRKSRDQTRQRASFQNMSRK